MNKARLAKAALVLTSAASLIGAGVGTAGASTAKAAAPTLKTLEKSLSTLEASFPAGTSLTEAGSSLVYPLMVEWEGHGPAANLSPAAGGSGAGQSGAEKGTIDLGGSDPYLPASTLSSTGTLNIPLAVSAQTISYNVSGVPASTHIRLNGTILSEIYAGTITKWNDPAITAINKGVSLPAETIVPLHRSDSSGDTFLFTSYLDFQDPSGVASSGPTQLESWPNVSGSLAESGNGGMQSGCEATPGCIAYIGISYFRGSLQHGLGYAALLNGYSKAKQYIVPNTNSINDEVASFKHIPASGGISLVNSSTANEGYPITNFEYVIVKQSTAKAAAVKGFLAWAMDPRQGSSSTYLAPVDFRPLPTNALAVSVSLLNSIS